MKIDNRFRAAAVSWLLLMALATSGCESIALLPRPSLDAPDPRERRDDAERRSLERRPQPDSRAEIPREGVAGEVTGTVQKVDQTRREIHLRTTDAKMTVIKYDPATIVYSRDKEVPVDSLRYGDLILVKVVKNSRGEQYADLIRISS